MSSHLQCPECGEDAIPELAEGGYSEDQQEICPGCGELLGVTVDHDLEDVHYAEAKVLNTEKAGIKNLEGVAERFALTIYDRGASDMRTEILNIVRDLRDGESPILEPSQLVQGSIYPEILKRIHSIKIGDL